MHAAVESHPCRFEVSLDQGCILAARMGPPQAKRWAIRPANAMLNSRHMQPMSHRLTIELRRRQRDCHDLCCCCGRFFKPGDTAHSGYAKGGEPLCVGDCCSQNLAETAVRTYWQKRAYEVPEGDSSLWRYMDFSKFVLLVKEKAIYFARADHVGDKFEGAKGASTNRTVWDDYYLRSFREAILNPPDGKRLDISPEKLQSEAERLLKEMEALSLRQLQTSYLSCWHENETESEALWRLYCPPPSVGVAVHASFGSLNVSLGDDPAVAIGRVKYIDFRKEFAGPNDAIFRKRHSLSHEREVRAVISSRENDDALGIHRPVDLNLLIHQIVISPFASGWFEALLKETMAKFGVEIEVITSELMLEPFY